MKLFVPKESEPHEQRVAISPLTAKKFHDLGFQVVVETQAGQASGFDDQAYVKAGVTITKDKKKAYGTADLILKVQRPTSSEWLSVKSGAAVVGMLVPYKYEDIATVAKEKKLTLLSLELLPRITRAQSMDVLSSQANLAGYVAVIKAADYLSKAFPMLMTAAGTVHPVKVLILGAGVAGLQAIATARRLGAVVSAYDVRVAAKEQVESLGARFLMVEKQEDIETKGGYAKEISIAQQKKQEKLLMEVISQHDVVITTAQIPGKPAPILITETMVKVMRLGSVIIDVAVEQGGNCALTKYGHIIEKYGVHIVGLPNLPSLISHTSSNLYANNLYQFIAHAWDAKAKKWCFDDKKGEIIQATLVCYRGQSITHKTTAEVKPKKPAKKPKAKPKTKAVKKVTAPAKRKAGKTS